MIEPKEKQKQDDLECFAELRARVQSKEGDEIFEEKDYEVDWPIDRPECSCSFFLLLFFEEIVGGSCWEEEGECEIGEAKYHI